MAFLVNLLRSFLGGDADFVADDDDVEWLDDVIDDDYTIES